MRKNIRDSVLFIGLMALAAVAVADSSMDLLVRDLAGGDEQARVAARQVLPRCGVKAVPRLIPLLAHEDAGIAKTAFTVIWDIANEASQPGREADRLAVTGHLMRLVDEAQPTHVKVMGLRLLAVTVPEGYDVKPVATLLKDPELRDKARTALQRMGTTEACAALREALDARDPQFRCAVLTSLGELGDDESLRKIQRLARHSRDARVRAAAARALAWTGDPDLVKTLRSVCEKATPETEFEATDALLRLADAMAVKGGNWETAIALYLDVLESASDGALKAAAMIGLGKYGDETVVAPIVQAAKDGDPRLQAAMIPAFEALGGRGSAKAIMAACPELPREVQLGLVEMFGRKQDAVFLPAMMEAAKSDDPPMRMAGLRALVEAELPDGISALVEAAQSENAEEQEFARTSLEKLARSMRASGKSDAAGRAALSLYGLATDDAGRLDALEGIAQCPIPEAFDVAMAAVNEPALEEGATAALIAVAEKLMAAGDSERALKAYRTVSERDTSVDTIGRIAGRMNELGAPLDTSQLLGFVTRWRLVGPFDWREDKDWQAPFVGEPAIDLEAKYKTGDEELAWFGHETTDGMGMVSLYAIFDQREHCFAYAYAEVTVDDKADVEIRVGTDDGLRLWVNEKLVHDNNCDRPLKVDEDRAKATLNKGVNRILVKSSQVAGGWGFCLRIMTPDGKVLPFTQMDS